MKIAKRREKNTFWCFLSIPVQMTVLKKKQTFCLNELDWETFYMEKSVSLTREMTPVLLNKNVNTNG